MKKRGKSDSPIVPGKLPNKDRGALRFAEGVEGRGLAEGNLFQQPRFRTQSRSGLQNALRRIRQAARTDILSNDEKDRSQIFEIYNLLFFGTFVQKVHKNMDN